MAIAVALAVTLSLLAVVLGWQARNGSKQAIEVAKTMEVHMDQYAEVAAYLIEHGMPERIFIAPSSAADIADWRCEKCGRDLPAHGPGLRCPTS